MGLYKYLRESWKNTDTQVENARLIQWRKDPVTLRLEYPTRLDRARSLGYKAKQGFLVVRQMVDRGGHERPQIKGGRRPKHNKHRLDLNKSYQTIAEERASKKYVNCEVLNSYWVGEDGLSIWYDVILVDRAHPNTQYLNLQRARAHRGLTSSGRKSRGLRHKGKGAEKFRPSKRANIRRRIRKFAPRHL